MKNQLSLSIPSISSFPELLYLLCRKGLFNRSSNWQLSLLVINILVSVLIPVKFVKASTILLKDNFDSEIPGRNNPTLMNWTISNGTIDVIGFGDFDPLPGNGRYLDLDGSSNNAGQLTSIATFIFNPGDVVELQFDLAGNNNGSNDIDFVTVSLGDLFSDTFSLASSQPFITFNQTLNVSSAITTQLIFDHSGGDQIGMIGKLLWNMDD